MRSIIIFALIAFTAMPVAAQEKIDITTRLDSLSYAIGMNIGQNFKMQSLTIDVDKLAAGMRDVLKGNTRLSEEQAGQVVVSLQ